ncbi:50S Ribosomal protein [Trema orientale]|uniref:50S Ribosomal protein n=1 Tax=Trema orientale TaxID=63057 RepID=A0A2P5D519_TREOI|nr:50S Ribosomal protein [Trema orientale]
MSVWLVPSSPFTCSSTVVGAFSNSSLSNQSLLLPITTRSYLRPPRLSRHIRATTPSSVGPSPMEAATEHSGATHNQSGTTPLMKLLFVEMGVGYDQHGQDITAAAMRACRDAISSNSIPAFRRGSIPGVTFEQMKLQIKLGVPRSLQQSLDIEKVKAVFPYGKILNVEVVDGGLICSSGVHVEEMGDKNDDCYIVNAAVYVGY